MGGLHRASGGPAAHWGNLGPPWAAWTLYGPLDFRPVAVAEALWAAALWRSFILLNEALAGRCGFVYVLLPLVGILAALFVGFCCGCITHTCHSTYLIETTICAR